MQLFQTIASIASGEQTNNIASASKKFVTPVM